MKRSFWNLLLIFVLMPFPRILLADPVPSSPETPVDNGQRAAGLPVVNLSFQGVTISAEVANEDAVREMGLRFRKTLGKNEGMLFVYSDSQPRAFWMKDAPIPLSVAFLDDQGAIVNLDEMKPLTETPHSSKGTAKFVLEMNGGWFTANGVKPGDKITGVLQAPPDKEALENPPYTLDSFQLSWGTAQIRRMLQDRPEMAKYVKEGDDLWNWTMRQYAGEYLKGGVRWDPGSPDGAFDSTAVPAIPSKGQKAYIQNTQGYALKDFHTGEKKTGPVLWWEMMLEFSNLRNRFLFDSIDRDASAGKIGRADFAFEYMAVEDIATNNIAHGLFYGLWLPHCRKLSVPFEDKRSAERFGKVIGRGWDRETFLKTFQAIGKKDGPTNLSDWDRFIAKDFSQHYDWYTNDYDKDITDQFKKKKLPVPDPHPSSKIEKKFLDELAPPSSASTVVQKLEPEGEKLLIDDFENGVGVDQFGSLWHTVFDQKKLGTRLNLWPFEPVGGGSPESPNFAARISGHFGKHIAPWPFAVLRGGFDSEDRLADLTAFSAVRFYAKGDKKVYLLQVVQPNVKDYSYYQGSFHAPSQWTQVTLPFASFEQPAWGSKVPREWDKVQLFQFSPDSSVFNDEDFDLWIDDIELMK